MAKSNKSIEQFMVLANGSVDIEASANQYRQALIAYMSGSSSSVNHELVVQAVHAIFDKVELSSERTIKKETLVRRSSNFIVNNSENELSDKEDEMYCAAIEQYIENYQVGNELGNTPLFQGRRGPGGGILRIARP